MSQNTEVLLSRATPYTRVDFIALRCWLGRLPLDSILDRYYDDDSRDERQLQTPLDLKHWLQGLKADLIANTQITNPHLAQVLTEANRTEVWSSALVNHLLAQAEKPNQPRAEDSISRWFRPTLACALSKHKIQTLEQLIAWMDLRGPRWWLPFPRLGPKKAQVIEQWLANHALASHATAATFPVPSATQQTHGPNKATGISFIGAKTDWDAITAYLMLHQNNPETFRAYEKELNRFLLWCQEHQLSLAEVLVDECRAYARFLAEPPPSWTGPALPRNDPRWKPFRTRLTPEGQRYALKILRTCFSWLVEAKFLAGNPWAMIETPPIVTPLCNLHIHKALSEPLWGQILAYLAEEAAVPPKGAWPWAPKDSQSTGPQSRLVRAALLLLGTTGIRRREAVMARTQDLTPESEGYWALRVLGKRNKLREVFLAPSVYAALQAHWADVGVTGDHPLLMPVILPETPAAKSKQAKGQLGFSVDALTALVKKTLTRLAKSEAIPLAEEDRTALLHAAPHALRHTWATHAVAHGVSLDIVRARMGHASETTTALYVQAERRRGLQAAKDLAQATLTGAGQLPGQLPG